LRFAFARVTYREPAAGSSTKLYKKFFKLVNWHDNEWGYSCRTVDLLQKIGKSL
jgi:glyceraldehyde 3-phosphate dehydrogenase